MDLQKLHLISLGCPKNLVDSELMLGRLMADGVEITPDPNEAHIIVVNTCSFIESATNESIDKILAAARYKKTGRCRRLVVTGCLPERYQKALAKSLPEVDAFLGTGAYEQIVSAATGFIEPACCLFPDPDTRPSFRAAEHRTRSMPHLAYIKIAEGCNRHCTYCIIPHLRGRQKSRDPDDIREEAAYLTSTGVKELILVAQETTAYGNDLSPASSLPVLLDQLARLPGDFRIRFLYGHPESITDTLVETVVRHPKICRYFDIPVQHASDEILKKMGRSYTGKSLLHLFERIRTIAPDTALRTTFLVGFPGETDEDFEQVRTLIQEVRFDHAGVFVYSDAEDIPSHRLKKRVPPSLAQSRRRRLMRLQAALSLEKNQGRIGASYPVLLEKKGEKGMYKGRTPFQAPEIDGITRVTGRGLEIGIFMAVRITGADTYDLSGEVA